MSEFRINAELIHLIALPQSQEKKDVVRFDDAVCLAHESCKIYKRHRRVVKEEKNGTWNITVYSQEFCNHCGWVQEEEKKLNDIIYPSRPSEISMRKEDVMYVTTKRIIDYDDEYSCYY